MSGQHKKDVGAVIRHNGVGFRVWAPFADAVALTGSFNDWGRTAMLGEGDGYWSVVVPHAQAGQEYRYIILNGDRELSRNDPRTLQVTETAGNSVIVDKHFDWTDQDFRVPKLNTRVVYELHVGTFLRPDASTIGTFEDVTSKLDYLVELGVNTIELMPITTMSPVREWWGYTPMYMYTVESQYGGRHKFLEFVNEAHRRGIAVLLDVVYNHFGPAALNILDIWQYDGWSENDKGGIYFYNDWRSTTPWGETRPDFGRHEVRDYILDNVRMWMHDCHIDGFRVDSTIFIRNVKGLNDVAETDLPDGWSLLQQVNEVSRKLNPDAFIIAEDVGVNEFISKPVGEGGAGFTAQWELHFPQALREALYTDDPKRIDLTGILAELGKRYNDDVFQRVVFIDSHDSAANGSFRFNEVIAPGKSANLFARRQSVLAAALLMTTPGIPMILQGQEFMMDGDFNDWKGLEWDKAKTYEGVLRAFRHLIALRKNIYGTTAGLTGKGMNIFHVDEENKVIAYHRWQDSGPRDDVVVVVNFGNRSFEDYGISFPRDGTWQERFCGAHKLYSEDFVGTPVTLVEAHRGGGNFVLPASTALIFSQD